MAGVKPPTNTTREIHMTYSATPEDIFFFSLHLIYKYQYRLLITKNICCWGHIKLQCLPRTTLLPHVANLNADMAATLLTELLGNITVSMFLENSQQKQERGPHKYCGNSVKTMPKYCFLKTEFSPALWPETMKQDLYKPQCTVITTKSICYVLVH